MKEMRLHVLVMGVQYKCVWLQGEFVIGLVFVQRQMASKQKRNSSAKNVKKEVSKVKPLGSRQKASVSDVKASDKKDVS